MHSQFTLPFPLWVCHRRIQFSFFPLFFLLPGLQGRPSPGFFCSSGSSSSCGGCCFCCVFFPLFWVLLIRLPFSTSAPKDGLALQNLSTSGGDAGLTSCMYFLGFSVANFVLLVVGSQLLLLLCVSDARIVTEVLFLSRKPEHQ